eukprot:m.247712 g.247712  ORF g.247712 m.247712 type:complete len:1182 (-) comp15473_c0_seq1:193-3738(-)
MAVNLGDINLQSSSTDDDVVSPGYRSDFGDGLTPVPLTDAYGSAQLGSREPISLPTPVLPGGQGPPSMRKIFINNSEANLEQEFRNNTIHTSKYNIITFLPKFLFEQFSRYANLFFLFISIIQQIPGVSPTGPWTTITPLSVVLFVTALKELVEDLKRHHADDEVNNSFCRVLRMGTFVTIRWKEVVVGDIVKVSNSQFFPADMVLLSSSEPHAMCYIETANLDGETNLKIRQGLPATSSCLTARDARFLTGSVECELPNNRLYKFVGNVTVDGQKIPLGPDQLLLRGAQLRNTPWVYGLVVYTGHDAKLLQNASATPIKRSNVDHVTNKQIVGLFCTLIVLAIISCAFSIAWMGDHEKQDWYLGYSSSSPPQNGFLTFLTFIVLYNNLIPISLIVTLEIVKFVQAITFINQDADMYDEASDTCARARTSALNEELGQVEYIFSDKTGTLTCNKMQFIKCSIYGISYGDVAASSPTNSNAVSLFNDPALLDNLTNGHPTASVIREWLTLLAVCHTVVPERDRADLERIIYQATSPDERALVEAVKQLGFSFNIRTPAGVIINALGQEERYDVLNVLEFNSTRKRMSVIVRCPNGLIKLYCKGADSVIIPRLSPGQQHVAATEEHLRRFAADGLRTLCLSVAQLSEEQYREWTAVYQAASTAIVDRAQKLDDAAELIEKNLFLLGATAIEDRLQDNVPDTIHKLKAAGIKVWMLTGDKLETAINIGFSCKLLSSKMKLFISSHETKDEVEQFLLDSIAEVQGGSLSSNVPIALIAEGASLLHGLSPELREDWLTFAKMCTAVICCRVSPAQKADIVRLVRSTSKSITLAIGDGANDVGMIQAAHVGIGISGLEGLQAARAADYAIAQFKHLQKLLLVHGAWSYRRITLLILYCFYKNIALYLIQFWFATQNGWSGQILFERWNIALYNVIFTLLPPLALGMFQQHASKESLLSVPQLYKSGQTNDHFNTKVFWTWILQAIAHSLVFFWLGREAVRYSIFPNNVDVGMWLTGAIVYTMVVLTVCLKAGLVTTHWTMHNHIALWGSMVLWFVFTLVYFNMYSWETATKANTDLASEVFGIFQMMYSTPVFWFMALLIPVLCLFPEYTYRSFRAIFMPTMEHEIEARAQRGLLLPRVSVELGELAEQNASKYTGSAFSQCENTDSITQSDVIRRYDTNIEKPQGE